MGIYTALKYLTQQQRNNNKRIQAFTNNALISIIFLLQEPKLETITRETIETFRGQRTECKITTEKKDCEDQLPADLVDILNQQVRRNARNSSLTKVSGNLL